METLNGRKRPCMVENAGVKNGNVGHAQPKTIKEW